MVLNNNNNNNNNNNTGADLGGPGGPAPPDPQFSGPNVCHRRDSTARCRQNLAWAPFTQILDPHL